MQQATLPAKENLSLQTSQTIRQPIINRFILFLYILTGNGQPVESLGLIGSWS